MIKILDCVLFPTICQSICIICVQNQSLKTELFLSFSSASLSATSRTLIIYNSSIQISNRFASKPFLLSRPLCLYSTSWSVFRRKCIFFSISRACFGCGFHFSLSNLNWLELPSGFFLQNCNYVFTCVCFAFDCIWFGCWENGGK